MRTLGVLLAICLGAFTLRAQTFDANPLTPLPVNSDSLSTEKGSAPQLQAAEFTMKPQFSLRPDGGMQDFGLIDNSLLPPGIPIPSTQSGASRPRAVTYSNGYSIRRTVHKYASIATLPLFAAEAVVGEKLFDRNSTESDSLRSTHSALAAGIGVLFGVNTVTGVWNMWEARKDPNGRGKRMFHGISMLAADAGFVATAALAPHREDRALGNSGNASTHRAVAFASLGIATASYIYMLIAR